MLKSKTWRYVAAVSIALIIVVGVAYELEMMAGANQCSQLVLQGFTDVCGTGSATDGNLRITINGYSFAQTKDINFTAGLNYQQPLPYEVFLALNVTVQNVGKGNASMGPLWALLSKGSAYVENNTEFFDNATIPRGVFPNMTTPAVSGGIYLPPGGKVSYWAWFYVPFSNDNQPDNINLTKAISLQAVAYSEFLYGGNYEEHGDYICTPNPCQRVNVRFVIDAAGVPREASLFGV